MTRPFVQQDAVAALLCRPARRVLVTNTLLRNMHAMAGLD